MRIHTMRERAVPSEPVPWSDIDMVSDVSHCCIIELDIFVCIYINFYNNSRSEYRLTIVVSHQCVIIRKRICSRPLWARMCAFSISRVYLCCVTLPWAASWTWAVTLCGGRERARALKRHRHGEWRGAKGRCDASRDGEHVPVQWTAIVRQVVWGGWWVGEAWLTESMPGKRTHDLGPYTGHLYPKP